MEAVRGEESPMRVLLLSIYYPPEIGANSRIVEGLARELAAHGDRVTVLTDLPHYPEGVVRDGYRGKVCMREQQGGATVIRNWLVVAPRESNRLRILNNVSFALSSLIGGLWSGGQDVLYVYSPPLLLGLTAYVLSRLKGIPFVFNVQDIYPEIAVEHGVLRNQRLIRLLERFEVFVYGKAAHVTVISEGFKRNLVGKGVAAERISVIPNWVEGDLFGGQSRGNSLLREGAFLAEYGLVGDRFVVMYAGNIGYSQGLETVIEAARLLADRPELVFVIVGDGVKKGEIVALAEGYGLENVVFMPYQPRERMPEVLASADACLVILAPEKSKTTIQSKTYEIMAMARPVIGSVDGDGDNWKLIEEAGAGVWAAPGDAAALVAGVRRLAGDRELGERLGQNGRAYIEARNTALIVGRQYRALLERVARTGSGAETPP
jgi:glycosyltransferase involved in cell wall biosynthesis